MSIAVVTQAVSVLSPSEAATNYLVTTTTSLTITIPAAVAVDDILIVCCTNRDAITDPSVTDDDVGGNLWAKILSGNNGTANASVWWKRATSATAGKIITGSLFTGSCVGYLSVFRGASTAATPYSNASHEVNASNDEAHAGFTPGENNTRIFLCVFNATAQITAVLLRCPNPGVLLRNGSVRSSGGLDCAEDFGSANQNIAAATGPFTWAQTNAASQSIVFALLSDGVTSTLMGQACL